MPIEIRELSYSYTQGSGGRAALRNVTLTVEEGEFLGIIGHTGSGKSTLLQHIGGIIPPESGTVLVDGMDFSDKKQRVEGRRRVGLVFQYPEYQLFEETVREDIAYGPRNMKLGEDEIARRVYRAMELVGLDYDRFAEKSPFELSGGEKRRAALAGIIAMEPRYLVLDEPMAGLDPNGRAAILDALEALRKDTGCAIVMVSHSMDDVARYSERLAVMNGGEVAMTGTPSQVFSAGERLREMGLDLPEMSRLAELMRRRGMDAPPVYTVEAMAEYLLGRAGHV